MPTFTISNAREFLALLRSNPEWKEEVRREILAEELLRLPAKVDHLEAKMLLDDQEIHRDLGDLKAGQARLEATTETLKTDVGELKTDVRQLKTDVHQLKTDVGELKSDVSVLKSDVGDLKKDVSLLNGRMGNVEGSAYETRYNLINRIGRHLRRGHLIAVTDLDRVDDAATSGEITEDEFTQLLAIDRLVLGKARGTGSDLLAAVELSEVVDANDVKRAAERAEIIRRFGYDIIAVAAGRRGTRGAHQEAPQRDVILLVEQPMPLD